MCPLLSLSHLVNFIFISFSVAFCVANVARIEFSLLFITDLTGLAAKNRKWRENSNATKIKVNSTLHIQCAPTAVMITSGFKEDRLLSCMSVVTQFPKL